MSVQKEKPTPELIKHLKCDLEALKYLTNFPNLYLYDYFSELRRSVDLAAAEKILELAHENLQLLDNYIDTIDKINSFERECLNQLSDNELASDVKANALCLIQLVENELNSTCELQDMRDLIYEEAFRLKNILFLNQTIEFVQEQDSEVDNLFSQMDSNVSIGKLVIIKNQYFSTRGLSMITKYFNLM